MLNYWQYFKINNNCSTLELENAYKIKFCLIEEDFSEDNDKVIKELLLCNKAFDTLIKPQSRYNHDIIGAYIKRFDIQHDIITIIDNPIFEEWLENTYNKYFNIAKNASESELTWNTNIMNILQIAIGLNQINEYIKKEKGLARIR